MLASLCGADVDSLPLHQNLVYTQTTCISLASPDFFFLESGLVIVGVVLTIISEQGRIQC